MCKFINKKYDTQIYLYLKNNIPQVTNPKINIPCKTNRLSALYRKHKIYSKKEQMSS